MGNNPQDTPIEYCSMWMGNMPDIDRAEEVGMTFDYCPWCGKNLPCGAPDPLMAFSETATGKCGARWRFDQDGNFH